MRWLARAFLGLILVAAMLLPALWLARDSVAPLVLRLVVNTALDAPVIESLAFRIDGLSPNRLRLADVTLNGDRGFSAARVELTYNWRRLLSGEVETAALLQPVIHLDLTEDGAFSLGALEPLRRFAARQTGGSGSGFPETRFTEATLRLGGAVQGRITATGAVWRAGGETRIGADGRIALAGSDWRADALAMVDAVHSEDSKRLQATLKDGTARQGDLSFGGLQGNVAATLTRTDGPVVTADLTAAPARAGDIDLAAPALHVRLDPLGMSAVARLGNPDTPELRIAIDTGPGAAGRRPVALDLEAELATIDRLMAATRRTAPLNADGRLTAMLRGSLPEAMGGPWTLWEQAVASGGVEIAAKIPGAAGTARLGIALARGRLSAETLGPTDITVDPTALPGERTLDPVNAPGPVIVTLGRLSESFRVLLESPFERPVLILAGPGQAVAAGGARAAVLGSATLILGPDGAVLSRLAGRASLRRLTLADTRVHSLDLTLLELVADAGVTRARGGLNARFDTAGFQDVALDLPWRAERRDGAVAVHLTAPGLARLAVIPKTDTIEIDAPVTVALRSADGPALRYASGDEQRVALNLAVRIPALGLVVPGDRPAYVDVTSLDGVLEAELVDAGGPIALVLDAGSVAIEPGTGKSEDADPGGVLLSDVGIETRGFARDAALAFERLVLSSARLTDRARAPRFTPLRAEGEVWRRDRPGLGFRGTVRGADGALVLDAEGSHDLATGSGLAEINLFPLVFVPGGLQPVDLSPAAAALFRQASGKIALAGTVAWPGTAVAPHNPLTLAVEKLSFTGTAGTVSEMTGAVSLSAVDPLSTPPGQKVRAAAIDVGVPIARPRISFALTEPGVLTLERIRATFAEGTVQARNIQVPTLSDSPVAVVLEVDGVDAAQLAAVTDLDGLTATGSLSGRLPLIWDPEAGLSLQGARLAATTPGGIVRYQPDETPSALLDAGEEGSLLLQAVRNLVYEQFEIEADGRPDEPFNVKLRVRGANPDLFDGYPVALNVSLSGRLDELFLNARRTLGLSDVLQRRIQAREPSG